MSTYNLGAVTAYGIALKNGFQGTEEEWLESLKGDLEDINLENPDAENAIQKVGSKAGARAFKIKYSSAGDTLDDGTRIGVYDIVDCDDAKRLVKGMKYVSCTSKMNAIGGSIRSVSCNEAYGTYKLFVDGYLNVPLNTNEDNPETGDVYNYLIIVDDPNDPNFVPGSIGDIEIGYGAVSLGDGSIVFAKNGFSSATNGQVLGKYGSVGGRNTKAGHCANAQGDNTRALGSCSSTGGSDTEATEFASSAEGVGTRAKVYGQKVVGRFNTYDAWAVFIVGAGYDDGNRYNCFVAGRDVNGSAYIKVGGQYILSSHFQKWLESTQNITNDDRVATVNHLKQYALKTDLPQIVDRDTGDKYDFQFIVKDGHFGIELTDPTK